MKQPWLKFFPSDWRADPALRMCSLGARGLWIEMLALMHEAQPYGTLLVSGKPVTSEQLAVIVGSAPSDVERCLKELEEAGVFSRDQDGALYSRRMRRDAEKSARDRTNGKSGGNPRLKTADLFDAPEGVKPRDNPGDKAQKPESRSEKPKPEDCAQDRIETVCREALGDAAPADAKIAPMLEVCARFGEERVALCLAAEARRERRRSIKTWRLWAEIVTETLARERAPPVAEPVEMAVLRGGLIAPKAAVLAAIHRWNAGEDWPLTLGGPPHRHGCALPEELLALCAPPPDKDAYAPA